MNKKFFSILFVLLITLDTVPCKNFLSFVDAAEITTISLDSKPKLKSAINTLNKSGDSIYINTPVINISSTSTLKLSGTTKGRIVGVKQSDGSYPVIVFIKQEM